MTGYRDDRAALKKRNEELEGEVAELRAKLAVREPGAAEPAPLVTGAAERPLPTGLIVVGAFALTAAGWMAAGPIVGTQLVILALVTTGLAAVLSRLFTVPGPHEAIVVSGGAGPPRIAREPFVRVPLVNAVHTLALTARLVPLAVDNAYSKGGVPLQIRGHAVVGIDPDEPGVRRAAERFLGTSDLEKVASETLEGVARERIAELTPEELSIDRLEVAESLRSDAEEAMAKLGLTILDLGIESVGDTVGYLGGLPRARIASALRDAENLERGSV